MKTITNLQKLIGKTVIVDGENEKLISTRVDEDYDVWITVGSLEYLIGNSSDKERDEKLKKDKELKINDNGDLELIWKNLKNGICAECGRQIGEQYEYCYDCNRARYSTHS